MGEVVKAVGMRGEVKVLPTGDMLVDVLESSFLRRRMEDGGLNPLHLQRVRASGGTLVIKFAEVDDRNAAEAMVGTEIGFAADDYDRPQFPRPPQPAPFVYHGLEVVTVDGKTIGTVDEILINPAHLILRVVSGDREYLIPVIPPVVRELNRETGIIEIDPIPGLLELEE